MKKIILFILSSPLIGYSQTGPGGIGSNDGTSNLVLWLNASTVSGVSGTTITAWTDNSGNAFDFTGGNGAILNKNIVNSYAAFNFNGSSNYFERPFTAAITPSNFTIFSTTNVQSTGTYKAVISNRDDPSGTPTAGFILYSRPSNNQWQFWTGTTGGWKITSGGTSTQNAWATQVLEYQNSSNGKILYINGGIDATSTHSMTSNPNRPCRIGAGRNESTPNYFFKGDISEIIMFDIVLNSAQKIIINNYLSAKYNHSLSTNNVYNEDNPANGDYDHDVAGIGRVDASNLHNDSQGTGIVRINNPTNLNDNEFFMWGHDNGIQQATNTTDVPAPVLARFDRVWRVSERNTSNTSSVNVGNIDISFDLTGLGSVTSSDLRLLIDTDNDGVFIDEIPIGGAISLGGNIYQFTNISQLADGLRFTLGTINNNLTPLPIELINFSARIINNEFVRLDWETASEINNDYFTIDKSQNGIDWESFKTIDGAGNSSMLLNYKANDLNPYTGVSYYRLKQTDFDGNFSYSNIKSINFNNESNNKIVIYPNPNKGVFTVDLEGDIQSYSIKIIDITGQIIYAQNQTSQSKLLIDLNSFSNGLYFVEVKTKSEIITKKILIQH